jgi:hypothetical protein
MDHVLATVDTTQGRTAGVNAARSSPRIAGAAISTSRPKRPARRALSSSAAMRCANKWRHGVAECAHHPVECRSVAPRRRPGADDPLNHATGFGHW